MNPVFFYKMSGSGNDFIIIDNREKSLPEENLSKFIMAVCRRRISVGADGVILIEKSDIVDFKWRFFNSDGKIAEMCGNGARCTALFAFLNGIAGSEMAFETLAGIIHASVLPNNLVKIKMTDIRDLKVDFQIEGEKSTLSSLNTGVPHAVMIVDNIEDVAVKELGREIRFHNAFAPSGTNVNFISVLPDQTVAVRTYERGVEDETLACGTGSVASAMITAIKFGLVSPVKILARSGETLRIYFKQDNNTFSDVYLEGDARLIYKAQLCEDALKG